MTISTPEIIETAPLELIGLTQTMNVLDMPIAEMWRRFRSHEAVRGKAIPLFYSAQHYEQPLDLSRFSPTQMFRKWTTAAAAYFDEIPEGFVALHIPAGLYAQFEVMAPPSAAREVFGYIYGEWLPTSGYALDHRPQVEVIPHDYVQRGEQATEKIWIPIR